jgi:hypothetical protein
LVYKRGAFVAGQLQIVAEVGRRAQKLLDAHQYEDEAERKTLATQVKTGRIFEKKLETHRKRNGL